MSNNITNKINQDPSPLVFSSFLEPQKIVQTPNLDINLAPTPSQTFYKKNTPIISTPQNLNLSLYQTNSFFQSSMVANSPIVPIQTPAMPANFAQSPMNTPMINLGSVKSPQAKITIYNPQMADESEKEEKEEYLKQQNEQKAAEEELKRKKESFTSGL